MTTQEPARPTSSNRGSTSIGLGIGGFLLVWIPILGIVGLALLIPGMIMARRSYRGGQERGVAIAGMLINGVGLAIAALYFLMFVRTVGGS